MTIKTAPLIILAAVLSACAPVTRYSIRSEAIVDTRAIGNPEAVIAKAKGEIIARGRAMGLTLRESNGDRIVLMEADSEGLVNAQRAAAADNITDDRSAVATAEFELENGVLEYSYWVRLVGKAPKNTTPDHEARMAAALLAIREVFERPLDTDMSIKPDSH